MPQDERETRAGKSKQAKGPEMADAFAAAITQALNSKEFIENITSVVMSAVSTKLDKFMDEQKAVLNKLIEENSKLKSENCHLSARVDATEQYLLRNNIRVYGIPENKSIPLHNKIMEVFNNHLGLNLTLDCIENCYRVGKERNAEKPRAVLVKFSTYLNKKVVYQSKAKLKKTGISVKEDLTAARLKIFIYACEKFYYRNVWSSDGVIFAKFNNEVVKLKDINEIDKLLIGRHTQTLFRAVYRVIFKNIWKIMCLSEHRRTQR